MPCLANNLALIKIYTSHIETVSQKPLPCTGLLISRWSPKNKGNYIFSSWKQQQQKNLNPKHNKRLNKTVDVNDLCVIYAEGTGGEVLHINMARRAQHVHPAMEEDVKIICAIKVQYHSTRSNIIIVRTEWLRTVLAHAHFPLLFIITQQCFFSF